MLYTLRYDGVDLFALINYIKRQPSWYLDYQNEIQITADFNDLIKNDIIARQIISRYLYFFNESIAPEMLDENTKSTTNHNWM